MFYFKNLNYFLDLSLEVFSTFVSKFLLYYFGFFFFLFLSRCWYYKMLVQYYYVIFTIKTSCLVKFIYFLKKHTPIQANQLLDIFIVDMPKNRNRFIVHYYLNSVSYNIRFLLVSAFSVKDFLFSCINIFPSAVWLERECWDMFGVIFLNNPDLRRILTDYGFKGFPLRKDFPLSGYRELFYNEKMKSLRYYRIVLLQEFRFYFLTNPWNRNL